MKIQFAINPDNISGFSDILGENDLDNKIIGTDDDDNILIDVQINKSNRDVLDELEDLAEAEEE